MILYKIAQPMNKLHWALLIVMILGCLGCMLFVGKIFEIKDITRQCAMLLIVFAIITEPLLRYSYQLCVKLLNKINQHHHKKDA